MLNKSQKITNLMKINVLHIIDQLKSTGGAENRLINDLKLINKKRIENMVFCLFKPDNNLVNFLNQFNIKVHYHTGNALFKFFYLAKLIQKTKPDIVHTQLFFSDICGRSAAFLCGVPIIVSTFQNSANEPNIAYYYSKKRRFLDFLTSKLCTHFIAVSDFVKKSVTKRLFISPKKISVIHNYVEIKRTNQLKNEKDHLTFCCVGKLNPAKGQFELIKAFKDLVVDEKNIRLVLAGDGPDKEKCRKYVLKRNLSKYVDFLGNIGDVNNVLESSEAFVFPTHSEGLSLALLEAVLAKKPCIISSIPPNLEVINRSNCFFFEPNNSKSIFNAIKAFLELRKHNPEKLKEITKSAYETALKKFNPKQKVEELEELYFKLYCDFCR